MAAKRVVLRVAGGLCAALALYTTYEMTRYSWDDWAALVVQRFKGPLEVTVVNATGASIPVIDVGIRGFGCQSACVGPGQRRTCKLKFAEYSPLTIKLGERYEGFPTYLPGPSEVLPIFVTWRSHGSVDVVITDAGVAVVGNFSEEFP